MNAIIDIVGYFEDHNHDDRYYTEPEVDAAVAAAKPEIVTVGGAPAGFVFPAAQLTLGTSTFTTTTTGFLHARLATSGGLNCATTTTYFGWLEIDAIPIPSSRVGIGEKLRRRCRLHGRQLLPEDPRGCDWRTGGSRYPSAAGANRVHERCRNKLLGRWQRRRCRHRAHLSSHAVDHRNRDIRCPQRRFRHVDDVHRRRGRQRGVRRTLSGTSAAIWHLGCAFGMWAA